MSFGGKYINGVVIGNRLANEVKIRSEVVTLTTNLKLNAKFVKNTFAKIKNFFAPSYQVALA